MENKEGNMIVSVTEREVYLRCRRMWDYSSLNRQRLSPFVTKKALSLGGLIHKSFAEWLLNPQSSPVDLFKDAALAEIDEIQGIYLRQIGCSMSDIELAPLYESIDLGLAMVGNYANYWGSPLPKGFNLVQPEQKIEIPIAGHMLSGTLDAIIERNGSLYVLERKTFTFTPKIEVLQMNDQFLAYVWILERAFEDNKIGGLVYDGLWKKSQPPRGKSIDDLFVRHLITRPPEELSEFERNCDAQISEMASNPYIWPFRRWEGCNIDCNFEKLCTAQSRGEDVDYIKNTFYVVKEKDETD